MALPVTVGVLALQGAFREHVEAFSQLEGVRCVEVRQPEDLLGLDGLVIPGGESTTIGKLCVTSGLLEPLQRWTKANKPTWGTCAGMILMANTIQDGIPGQPTLGGLDVTARRNFFGSQLGSFVQPLTIGDDGEEYNAVFIRAPCIADLGKGVKVLATVAQPPKSHEAKGDGSPVVVAVQQGNLIATAFHPELVPDDVRWHARFVQLCREAKVKI